MTREEEIKTIIKTMCDQMYEVMSTAMVDILHVMDDTGGVVADYNLPERPAPYTPPPALAGAWKKRMSDIIPHFGVDARYASAIGTRMKEQGLWNGNYIVPGDKHLGNWYKPTALPYIEEICKSLLATLKNPR